MKRDEGEYCREGSRDLTPWLRWIARLAFSSSLRRSQRASPPSSRGFTGSAKLTAFRFTPLPVLNLAVFVASPTAAAESSPAILCNIDIWGMGAEHDLITTKSPPFHGRVAAYTRLQNWHARRRFSRAQVITV